MIAAAAGPDAMKRLSALEQPKALTALLCDVAAACQEALARGVAEGAAQPQALIQSYARLQQLRAAAGAADTAAAGVAVAGAGAAPALPLPPGAPAALEAFAKVLAAVESLTAAPMPTDASSLAKSEQVGQGRQRWGAVGPSRSQPAWCAVGLKPEDHMRLKRIFAN